MGIVGCSNKLRELSNELMLECENKIMKEVKPKTRAGVVNKRLAIVDCVVHIERPKTETITYMVLFSQRTVQLPSVVLSQKQLEAVCRPAPFFCMMTQVTKQRENGNIKVGEPDRR